MADQPSVDRHLCAVLARACMQRPDHPWIAGPAGTLTYAQAETRAGRLAAGLSSQGLVAGEPVLVMLPDTADALLCWIAATRLGAADVPINVHYRGDILAHVVNDSAARLMIVDASFLDRLVELRDRLPGLERLVVRGPVPTDLPWPAVPLTTLEDAGALPLRAEGRESDLMSVMYTSGTTGPSKGVMVAHAHAFEYATATIRLLEMGPEDVVHSAGLPLFHIAGRWGVFLAAAIVNATVFMPDGFSASRFWTEVRATGATKVFLLGAMGSFLQQQEAGPGDRDHRLTKVILAPLLPNSREFADRFGVRLAHAFGATEFNTPILLDDATDVTDPQLVGTVRHELFAVQVVDDDDRPVPDGMIGELVVRPHEPWIVTLGYWRHPEWTVESWRNLWFHTGDLGRRDAAGRFYFTDRKKDSIRRRGENISSMEVEGVIAQHPAVAECAVFPVAATATEQEVMVAVVARAGVSLNPVELIDFLAGRLPRFMVPRYVDCVAALPRTATGKVQKPELRRLGVTATTWDRDAAARR